jgi:hypothetical protein
MPQIRTDTSLDHGPPCHRKEVRLPSLRPVAAFAMAAGKRNTANSTVKLLLLLLVPLPLDADMHTSIGGKPPNEPRNRLPHSPTLERHAT